MSYSLEQIHFYLVLISILVILIAVIKRIYGTDWNLVLWLFLAVLPILNLLVILYSIYYIIIQYKNKRIALTVMDKMMGEINKLK